MTAEQGLHIALVERDFLCRREMAHLGINWELVDPPSAPPGISYKNKPIREKLVLLRDRLRVMNLRHAAIHQMERTW